MRYFAYLFSAFLLVVATGCVSTNVTKLDSAPTDLPANVDTSSVAVYSDTASVGCSYDRVALIEAQGSTSGVETSKMIEKAKTDAAKQGANALIIGKTSTDDPDYNPLLFGGSDYGSRTGRFLAVHEKRPCN